ncbi:hypothetical protein A2501_02275 [Candidatus Uhrbacteria bacterium RIFOXYC12_FULL_57_11]|nr:MAG: hypothetical protein A2501_02275 [Candidatus Uhrbacteria bacterium RIFOXYC12_FULL_57_11]
MVSREDRYHVTNVNVFMNRRGEYFQNPREAASDVSHATKRTASKTYAETRPSLSARERKHRRDEDARKFAETTVRATGDVVEARARVERGLGNLRDQMDSLTEFDPKLQEEYEFLKAQQEALALMPDREMATKKSPGVPEISIKSSRKRPESLPGLFDRMRSGWTSLKIRLFGPPELQPAIPSGTTAYEATWTEERKAQRSIDRAREVASVQERAIETIQTKLDQENARLHTVTQILMRRRKQTMPANARAKYVVEVQTIKARIRDSERLLRIAEADRDRKRIQKIAA